MIGETTESVWAKLPERGEDSIFMAVRDDPAGQFGKDRYESVALNPCAEEK